MEKLTVGELRQVLYELNDTDEVYIRVASGDSLGITQVAIEKYLARFEESDEGYKIPRYEQGLALYANWGEEYGGCE